MKKIVIFYTDHFINRTITQFLAKNTGFEYDSVLNYANHSNMLFVSYGFRRENEKIFKKEKNFIYIDHGYMNASERKFHENKKTTVMELNGYFRIIKNDFYFNEELSNTDEDRFKKLNIELKDINKNAEYIVVSEPSSRILDFLNIPNWTEETLIELKKHTDRKIIVHNKYSDIPLNTILKKAFAFVSCQSTAAFTAIANGVPSYFTHKSMKKFGELKDIENRKLNHNLLFVAANSQWKLSEFFSDEFQSFFNRIINQ